MYDAPKIIFGLGVFFLLCTSPVWYNAAMGSRGYQPALEKPVAEKQCIEPAVSMRENHMTILNNWRDSVVRDGNRIYTAQDGKEYTMSLSNTCLKCHLSQAKFCDQCHTYAAVAPTCWNCHVTRPAEELK